MARPCGAALCRGRSSVIGGAKQIGGFLEGWSHEERHSSQISPDHGGDDRRHRVRDLFDLWRRRRQAEARHRYQDASGLDGRQRPPYRSRRPPLPLQAEIRRLHQIAVLPRSLGDVYSACLPNAARNSESCALSGLSASPTGGTCLCRSICSSRIPRSCSLTLCSISPRRRAGSAPSSREGCSALVPGSLILRCSSTACSGVSSPSLTARRISSHEASCISRVVSRMLSVA